ncbi:MAG: FkbM family methyltransferase [Crocinitomicaceae bacterium]|nr:FkbM family methyltransferase [Crocinitomicaceae bacterium]
MKILKVDYDKFIRDIWFTGRFKVTLGETSFYLYSTKSDKGMLEIFYKGMENAWDAKSIQIWMKLASRSENAFDIGANFGLYSVAAKAANPTCTVHAFEPSLNALSMLKKNISVNDFSVEVSEVALSNVNGTADFHDMEQSSAASSLVIDEAAKNNAHSSIRKVQTLTFSDFVEQKGITNIDLISIDVELFETEVLEGMGDLISKHKPDFLIEVMNNEAGEKIERFFEGEDYLFFEINETAKTLTERNHLRRENANQDHSFNFLICSKETAAYLEGK